MSHQQASSKLAACAAMGEASFAMKLWGATYYMTASMVVQLMNKVPTLRT